MPTNSRGLIIGGAILLAVVGLATIFYLNVRPTPAIADLVQFPRPARGHDNDTAYAENGLPPAGGIHFDIWQNCGIYSEPIETGNAVHSLEHGAVWITYQPELPADQVTALQDRVRGQTYILLSPFPGQRSPVVLSAWGLQLEVNSAGDGRIDEFIARYRLGPQTPEPGAVCTGGVGEPQS